MSYNDFTIVVDTREQTPWRFPEWVKTVRGTLKTGDYAVAGDANFSIERKSLDDFVGTIFSGWNRFSRELMRMKTAGYPARIIIIEADFEDLLYRVSANGNIVSPSHSHIKITPQAIIARIAELSMIGVSILFCRDSHHAALMAYGILAERNSKICLGTSTLRNRKTE